MIVICKCKVPMIFQASSNGKHIGLTCGNSKRRKGFCRSYIALGEEVFGDLKEEKGIKILILI